MLAGLAVLLSNAAAFAADAEVKIANFTFDPPTLTVPVGTTVTWTNGDDIAPVIKETDNRFHSDALDTGDTFSQTFTTAGRIEYFCAIHPRMTGKIVVTP
jgi:plastocyanin